MYLYLLCNFYIILVADYVLSVVYEITAVSLQYLSVMFEHPLHNSMFTGECN